MRCPPTAKHPRSRKDPVADGTDVYAFVSPDRPDTVTLIANFIPLQTPDGGPNFYEFGDDVLYEIHIANRARPRPDVIYQFRFNTKIRNQKTFLYNTGPITDIGGRDLEPAAVLQVTRVQERQDAGARRRACPARRSTSASAARRTTRRSRTQAVHRPARRSEGLRRPAGRRVPRRPRQHLRPRRAASVQRAAPDLDAEHERRQRRPVVQRAHDRDPGADQRPDPQRQRAEQPAGARAR